MDDKSIPAIFEAAFEYDGIRIRVDVLERLALRRLGTARGEEQHRPQGSLSRRPRATSVTFSRVLAYAVTSVELLHVNSAYVRGPGGICWTDFFARVDVGDALCRKGLSTCLAAFPRCVIAWRMVDLPDAEPGQQCGTPYGASSGTGARRISPLTGSAIFPSVGGPGERTQGARH